MSLQPATFPAGAWDGTTDYRGANDDKSPNYALTDRLIAELVAVQDYLIGTGLLPSIEFGGANQLLGMDSGGTTLEYKPITVDASGNIAGIANIVATGTINSGAITSSGGVIGTSLRSPSLFALAATGNNVVGTDIVVTPGASTGNATGSRTILKSSSAAVSGSTVQTQYDGFIFGANGIASGFNSSLTQAWKLSGQATLGSGTVFGRLDLGDDRCSLIASAAGSLSIYSSSAVQNLIISGYYKAQVLGGFSWASSTYSAGSNGISLPATDLQMSRVAGPLVQINNGTLGTLRGIQAASIEQIAATGTNTVASDFAIKIGSSTGNAASAKFIVQAPAAGSTGTTVQTLSDTFIFERNQLTLRKTGGTETQQFTVAHDATNDYIRYTKAQNSSGDAFLWNVSGSDVFAITRSGGAQLAGGWWLRWCNGTATATADVGLTRVSPGLLAVFNGVSATTFADFQIQNLVTSTTTGTKIGTSATQKIGFFGGTPIVRPVLATGSTADQIIIALQSLGLVSQT